MNMKRILFLSSIVALLSSCGGSGNGELIGGLNRASWNPTDPYGMVFIPQGSFVMGPSDQDVPFSNVSTNQRVSVGAFYMDETEITNNEYRQFERWVVDSIIRSYLGKFQTEGPRNEVTLVKSNYLVNLAEIKNNDEISLNLYNFGDHRTRQIKQTYQLGLTRLSSMEQQKKELGIAIKDLKTQHQLCKDLLLKRGADAEDL